MKKTNLHLLTREGTAESAETGSFPSSGSDPPETGAPSHDASAQQGAGGSRGRAERVPMPARKWKSRVALPVALLIATAGVFGMAMREVLQPVRSVRVAAVVVKDGVAAPAAGVVVTQAPGWVEADPFPVSVSALADGVVAEVLVLEGERVEQGQVVARLVPDEARFALDRAEAVLLEREAALASARAAHQEAQSNWEHPIELTRRLKTAEAELAEKRSQLERWPSDLAAAEAHAVYLEAEFKRTEPLFERGQANDIELVQARQAHERQQAVVESVRRQEPILEAQIRLLEAEVEAAEEDLRLRIADTRALAETEATVQRAKASVASARANRDDAALRLERMEVRTPAAGVVMTRLAEPGSKLMLGGDNPHSAQVVRLYDPQHLQVRVDIPLVDAAKVGLEQPAEVVVDVLPDRVYRGRLTRVVHEADVQKNTLQVKVAIEDPTPELKPEMLARARFLAMAKSTPGNGGPGTGTGSQRLFVPEGTVFEAGGGSYVWLADQVENVAHRQQVSLGTARLDGWVAVEAGLNPGDRVILDPPADLATGQRIEMIQE
jgi:HlyD family secretion protein